MPIAEGPPSSSGLMFLCKGLFRSRGASRQTSGRRKRQVAARGSEDGGDDGAMVIGTPTNVKHVAHVTFDREKGFVGLPPELQQQMQQDQQLPMRPASAGSDHGAFGITPEKMKCRVDDHGNKVPDILLQLQTSLYSKGGLQAEGIFRVAADGAHEGEVRRLINDSGDVPEGMDVHALAGLIKAWFRELPEGLLDSLQPEQVASVRSAVEARKLATQLPSMQRNLLQWVVNLMADVAQREEVNKMNTRNVATVFAPNLTQIMDPAVALLHIVKVMELLRLLVEATLEERTSQQVQIQL